jgi:ATP-dependent helicase HrpA
VAAESFRWLVEEYRVSLFAQELGTAEPVSAVRLQRALEEMALTLGGTTSPLPPKPAPVTAGKKTVPLKSLGALDQLFRK